MKIKFLLLLTFGILNFVGCASVHPGHKAVTSNNAPPVLPIIVSANNIESSKNSTYQLIEVTIENKSGSWFRAKSSKLIINNPSESGVSVIVGNDLKDWGKAMAFKNKMDKHNNDIAMGSLAAAGTAALIAGADNNNSNLTKAGSVAILSAEVWGLTEVINESLRNAEGVQAVPENHLYHSFSIPGKMFVRKWLLLNKPIDKVVNKLVLEIESNDNEKDTYEVTL